MSKKTYLIQCIVFLILLIAHSKGMSAEHKKELKEKTKQMIYHAFNGYMNYGFPEDELKPITCKGKTRDYDNPDNYGINDVLGNYTLTLIDSLDTLAIIGDKEAFQVAVNNVIKTVDFDCDCKVQVFEVNIRILGGLLSGHLFAISDEYGVKLDNYNNELLDLAYELGKRLLPAFKNSRTGIPLARVNLKKGILPNEINNCSAGAGTLILEFGTLSRLTGDMRFENYARKALFKIWNERSALDLLGNTINANNSQWQYTISGIGAGIDSIYEYMLKAYILFGDPDYLRMFNDAYSAILRYNRNRDGLYLSVNMKTGLPVNSNMDGLSAFFPGLQVLVGDLPSAIHLHQIYVELWKRYHAIPEVFNFNRREIESDYYLLRPEFIESNYMLYQATKDPYYLDIGEMVLNDIENYCKTECGYAQLNPLTQLKKEDRMESFFISETLKYLYLLFDEDNKINNDHTNSLFTTEGHFLVLPHTVYHNKSYENSSHFEIMENDTFVCPNISYHIGNPLLSEAQKKKIFVLVNKLTPREELYFTNSVCPKNIKKETIELHVKSDNEKDKDNYPLFEITEKRYYYVINTLYDTDIEITKFGSNQLLTKVNKRKLNLNKNVYVIMEGIEFLLNPDAFQDSLNVYNLKIKNKLINGAKAVYGPQLDNYQIFNMDILPIFKNSNFKNPELSEGCSDYSPTYKELIQGKVIMLSRGGCFFSDKTLHAMKAGAAGVIVVNTSNQIFGMSPNKELNFDPVKHKRLLEKFKELKKELIDMIDNNTPLEERKQEEDEFSIPSLMIGKDDGEFIMRTYLETISNYPKNEFKNLLKLYRTVPPVNGTLSWNLMGFKMKDLTKVKSVDLQYDNKIISNIKIIKTRRKKVLDNNPPSIIETKPPTKTENDILTVAF